MKLHLLLLVALFTSVQSMQALAWSFELGGVNYPDSEMTDFNSKIKDRYIKMRQLLDKNQKCLVAIDGFMSKYFRLEVTDRYLPGSVNCIADIVINEGTLKEKSGCALARYDLNQDSYAPYFNRYFPQGMASKPCAAGGFEELLALRGWWSGDAWQNSTVEETLFTPKKLDEPWQWILVYAKSEKYVKWFSDARARGKAFVEAEQKSKKSQ